MTARKALFIVAVIFAIGEGLDSIDIGWPALIFAVLFVIGALLIGRGTRVGVGLVGFLLVWEVALWPTFDRSSTKDWIIQTPFLILGVIGLGLFGVVVYRGLQARRAPRSD